MRGKLVAGTIWPWEFLSLIIELVNFTLCQDDVMKKNLRNRPKKNFLINKQPWYVPNKNHKQKDDLFHKSSRRPSNGPKDILLDSCAEAYAQLWGVSRLQSQQEQLDIRGI